MTSHARRTTSHRALAGTAVAAGLLALMAPLSTAAPSPAASAPARAGVGVGVGATVGEWPQLQGNAAHTGVAADRTLPRSSLKALTPAWSRTLATGLGAPTRAVVSGGLVYVGDAGVSAYRVSDGSLVWHTKPPYDLVLDRSPAVQDGIVVVTASTGPIGGRRGLVWALDASTGATVWTRLVKDAVLMSPTVSGSSVYVTAGSKLLALSLHSGRPLWTSTVSASSPPTVVGSSVLVSQQNPPTSQELFSASAVDAGTGAVRWSHAIPQTAAACRGYDVGTVLALGTSAYVGQCLTDLEALGSATGASLWSVQAAGSFSSPLAGQGDRVFSSQYDRGVEARDRSTGALLWSAPVQHVYDTAPVVVGSTLVLPTSSGGVDLRDTTTGALVGTVAVGASSLALSSAAVAEGHVVVVGVEGGVVRLVALAPPAG